MQYRQHNRLLELYAGNLRFLRFLSLDGCSLCVREAAQQQGIEQCWIELIELPAFSAASSSVCVYRFLIVNRKRIARICFPTVDCTLPPGKS